MDVSQLLLPPNRAPQKVSRSKRERVREGEGGWKGQEEDKGRTINKLSTHRRTRLRRSAVVVFLPGMANAVVVSHCRPAGANGKRKVGGCCGRCWHGHTRRIAL